MKSLTDSPGRYERCKMDLHLPGFFLAQHPEDYIKNLGKGGWDMDPRFTPAVSPYLSVQKQCLGVHRQISNWEILKKILD